jgi:hypothetical protein
VNIQVQRIYENRILYRGKQSFFAAMGTYFVIFCSTMSNALPLESDYGRGEGLQTDFQ